MVVVVVVDDSRGGWFDVPNFPLCSLLGLSTACIFMTLFLVFSDQTLSPNPVPDDKLCGTGHADRCQELLIAEIKTSIVS